MSFARYSTVNVPAIFASQFQVKRALATVRLPASTAGLAGGVTSRRFHSEAALLAFSTVPPFLVELTTQRTCVPRSSAPTVSDNVDPLFPVLVHSSLPRGAVCQSRTMVSAASPSTFVDTANSTSSPSSATAARGVTVAEVSLLPSNVENVEPTAVSDETPPAAVTKVTRHS